IEILLHPKGGLKNIPAKATRQLLLTQPESTGAVKIGKEIADRVIGDWDRVVIGSLRPNPGEVLYTREWVSGVVLAAGSSTRYGKPKIHENFRGKSFLNNVCETAKLALDEVVVVTKPNDRKALSAAMDLGLKFVINQHPEAGQSGSIRLGIDQINPKASGVIFLHADQPQTSPLLLRALRDHALEFVTEIVAPLIDGQRGNPVYFDRSTFRELAELEGDQGGRQIFHRHRLSYVDWLDRKQLIDVDTPAQLRELLDE
ncbi:MAG TPA: nucleotidyltransferase family protein, partial [Anaerolineales bacterium]|nr:nucleotidyltransferase family protein [Anaerolineales bacterium]